MTYLLKASSQATERRRRDKRRDGEIRDSSNVSNQLNKMYSYNVECILGVKFEHGKTWFLIKWEGYSQEHNSWEAEDNIETYECISSFFYVTKTKLSNIIMHMKLDEMVKNGNERDHDNDN